MSNHIFEELPARKHAPAAAAVKAKGGKEKGATEESSEKRIRQAVYDIRYRARREDIDLRQAFSQYMSNSSLNPAERTAVKAKLFGKGGGVSEQYAFESVDWATDTVANALFKVFVEGVTKEEVIELPYEKQLFEEQERKYKVRVTDPKNDRSYVRYATRDKITQLRARGLKVEMTEHGEPYEGERKRGESTARALGGGGKKKLDPVGKEDKDIDNDGDHDKSDKYLLKRRKAIGKAISMRRESLDPVGQEDKDIDNDGDHDKSDKYLLKRRKAIGKAIAKEEFLSDGTTSVEGQNNKKIDIMPKTESNKIVVFPQDQSNPENNASVIKAGVENQGSLLSERAVSKAQQRFMGMVYAAKKGEEPASPEVAAAAKGISKKEAKKFAKTKHKGLPETVKESGYFPTPASQRADEAKYGLGGQPVKPRTVATQAGAKIKPTITKEAVEVDKGERDTRADYAYRAMIKNKLRSAMGVKNPMVTADPEKTEKMFNTIATSDNAKVACETNSPTGELLDERRKEDKVAGTPRKPRDKAYEIVRGSMRKMEGTPAGQRKKEPGKKPPAAGEYGAPRSPAQKVAMRRADAQRSQDMMHSPRD